MQLTQAKDQVFFSCYCFLVVFYLGFFLLVNNCHLRSEVASINLPKPTSLGCFMSSITFFLTNAIWAAVTHLAERKIEHTQNQQTILEASRIQMFLYSLLFEILASMYFSSHEHFKVLWDTVATMMLVPCVTCPGEERTLLLLRYLLRLKLARFVNIHSKMEGKRAVIYSWVLLLSKAN